MVEAKEERLNIRVTPDEKEIINQAANISNLTVSAFVLQHVYPAAQDVLVSQTQFKLSDKKWESFCAALDSAPRDLPRLRSLLTQPSPLESMGAASVVPMAPGKKRASQTLSKTRRKNP